MTGKEDRPLWDIKIGANVTVFESGRKNIPGTDDFKEIHYVRSGAFNTAEFPKWMFDLKHGI